jgi:decaprenyl-phosphate phosphoribosyltransferase
MTVLDDRGSAPGALGDHRRRSVALAAGLFAALRPKQWIKSVLVPAAPAAAGVLFEPKVLAHTLVAIVTFTMCAAGGYLVNDAADVHRDRLHPTKRFRPIAAGVVPIRLARVVGVALVLVAVAAGGLLTNWKLAAALSAYVVFTVSYSTWLKHVAIVELMMVAAGFLLRPIAGAAATDVKLSRWFLIVASFGSLYMVVGKRYAEVSALGDGASGHRRILSAYPAEYLRQTRELAAAVTLLAYCLWAFERARSSGPPWSQLSIIPVTYGLLRYALLLERGQGGAPEEVVLRDRELLITGLVWLLLFGLSAAKVGS